MAHWDQPLNTPRLRGDCSRYGLDRLWRFTVTVFGPGFRPGPLCPGQEGVDLLCCFTPTVFMSAINPVRHSYCVTGDPKGLKAQCRAVFMLASGTSPWENAPINEKSPWQERFMHPLAMRVGVYGPDRTDSHNVRE